MSFTKYLETKKQPKTIIEMNVYQEKLAADLAALIIKPNKQLIEARECKTDFPYAVDFGDALLRGMAPPGWSIGKSEKKK